MRLAAEGWPFVLESGGPAAAARAAVANLAGRPRREVLVVTTVVISVLTLSDVPCPVAPRHEFRSGKRRSTAGPTLAGLFTAVTVLRYFFFPLLVLDATRELARSDLLELPDRLPDGDPLLDVGDGEVGAGRTEIRTLVSGEPAAGGLVPSAAGDQTRAPEPGEGRAR